MVVAEELGLKYEDVSIDFDYRETFTPCRRRQRWNDRFCLGYKGMCQHSEKADTGSCDRECKQSSGRRRHRMVMAAGQAAPSPLKGLKPEDLDMKDGNVYVKSDPSKAVPLARAVGQANLFATFSGRPPTALWATGMGKYLDTMNIAMCEVAVDTETGQVEIIRFGVVADPGKDHPSDFTGKPDSPGDGFQRRVPAAGRLFL